MSGLSSAKPLSKNSIVQKSELTRLTAKYPYLGKYLSQVSKVHGLPDYLGSEIPSTLKKAVKVNILYQVDEGVFIHIYSPTQSGQTGFRKYVIVEPPRPPQELVRIIEEKLASVITEKDKAMTLSERKNILLRSLQKVIDLSKTPINYGSFVQRVNKLKKIPVYTGDFSNLVYHLTRDKVGLGVLDPLLKDRYIEDIYCNGVGYVYIVHKVFGPLETNIYFPTEDDLSRFVLELSEKIGKPVSHARPIVDATLPDGSRINIVFGSDVSLKGSSFTIRKFSKVPMSVIDLINLGTMDEYVGAYLWMLLLEGMSGFISGETASGKTTTLNAIVAFIRPMAKIVSIEDTAEIQVPHENWLRELTRDTGSIETSVTLFDLLKAALRQRPNYIIVGEIRGAEGNVAFQAMQTGHPVLSTFHAASVERLVQRLSSPPINVPKTHLDNLNFVLIQSAVYREGIMLRRVISVNEIVGYDPKSDTTIYIPIFTWDPVKDRFTFRGRGTSYLLEEKIALIRGISKRNMNMIYDELGLRAKILRELVTKNVTNYYDVFKVLTRIYGAIDSRAKASSKEDTPYVILETLEDCLLKLKSGELLK